MPKELEREERKDEQEEKEDRKEGHEHEAHEKEEEVANLRKEIEDWKVKHGELEGRHNKLQEEHDKYKTEHPFEHHKVLADYRELIEGKKEEHGSPVESEDRFMERVNKDGFKDESERERYGHIKGLDKVKF